MHQNNVTKLGKIIGIEEKAELNALVHVVKNACQVETHHPEETDEEVEENCPFLGWKSAEVVEKTLEKHQSSGHIKKQIKRQEKISPIESQEAPGDLGHIHHIFLCEFLRGLQC